MGDQLIPQHHSEGRDRGHGQFGHVRCLRVIEVRGQCEPSDAIGDGLSVGADLHPAGPAHRGARLTGRVGNYLRGNEAGEDVGRAFGRWCTV